MLKNTKRILCVLLAVAMLVACAACGKNDSGRDPNAEYTYNSYLTTFPTLWNVHDYETSTDATIIDYTEEGFYTFDYNDTKDGYQIVTAMAKEFPVDVTADYIGQYGLVEGDKAKAWKIELRTDLKWEDGTPITSADFVKSIELLLNPVANNYRADSLYEGDMVVYNAKNYFYTDKTVNEVNSNGTTMTYTVGDLTKNADGQYVAPNGGKVYFALKTGLGWLNGYTLERYLNAYAPDTLAALNEYAESVHGDEGMVPVTDETVGILYAFTGSALWGYESMDDLAHYVTYEYTYGTTTFDQVGYFAIDDYNIVMVLEKELSGFYLNYSLTSTYLVKTDLYESCISMVDGVYTNSYGTSAETYMAYGPYKLESFQMDRQIVIVKNDNWYGYGLKENKDTYWTTRVVIDKVEDSAAAFQLFLQGKLDSYGLTKEEMDEYSKSEHTYYQPGQSTYFIALNPDLDALTSEQAKNPGTNKTIITLKDFRMALSLSLNRAEFCLATSPTNGPAYALFSELIVSDPDEGTTYRTTAEAKQAMVKFWGLADEIGEGKMYANVDDAIDSITGYNLDLAKEYFNSAYDQAIAEGLMTETDKVEICIGLPSTSSFYTNGYDFLVNNYTEAVKGTKLEGKLTFTSDNTIGNGFADALKSNQVNMLFGVGWTGSALNPYGLISAYTDTDYQYDPAWDTTTTSLTVTIDGVAYTASVWDWTCCLDGTEITVVDANGVESTLKAGSADNCPETRLVILAAIEDIVLQQYNMIPIMDASSATIKGMQIKYYTEDYVFGMGRGGVKYYTYNYTDAEWDAFVAENNGELNYK